MKESQETRDGRNSGVAPRRSLGFWALVAFGVGDILGAGIYALVGEIAKVAGHASWVAFLVALVVAGITALSYAELSSRFPRSGGEAYFCERALGSPRLALMTGWLVLCSGVVSMATIARAFGGYFLEFMEVDTPLTLTFVSAAFLVVIGAINFWGIRQTSVLNIFFTLIEAAGLFIVLAVGWRFLAGTGGVAEVATPTPIPTAADTVVTEWVSWTAILQAGALAFFAFIGFEDMVNVAEEARNPRRNLPAAILVSVAVTGGLYLLAIHVATSVVDPATLGESKAPLLEVVNRASPEFPSWVFAAIALFAVGNTALLNFVTASRLLYGMSGQKLIPAWFGALHARTRTPHRAIVTILIVTITLAMTGTLSFLAGTTSLLILLVFVAVNASLIATKTVRRTQLPDHEGFETPLAFPILALASCLALIAFVPLESFYRGFVLVAIGFVLLSIQGRIQPRKEAE